MWMCASASSFSSSLLETIHSPIITWSHNAEGHVLARRRCAERKCRGQDQGVCVCVRVYLLYISGARQYTIEALCKVALETHKESG